MSVSGSRFLVRGKGTNLFDSSMARRVEFQKEKLREPFVYLRVLRGEDFFLVAALASHFFLSQYHLYQSSLMATLCGSFFPDCLSAKAI